MVVVQHCGENGVPGVRERKRDCEWDGKRGPVLLLHVLLRLLLLLCAPLCVLVSASLLLCERDGCAGGRSSRVCECRPRRRRGYARNTLGTQCVRADVYIECLFQVIVLSQAVVEFVCERVST